MKISKLFHWLYGFLMFLPLLAIGITCFYVVFNPNAKDSYNGSTEYLNTVNYKNYIQNKPLNPISYNLNNTSYYYYSSTNFNNIEFLSNTPYDDNLRRSGYLMFNCSSFIWNDNEYDNIKSVVVSKYNSNFNYFLYDIVINEDYFYIPRDGANNYGLFYLDISTKINPVLEGTSIYTNKIEFRTNLNINRIYSDRTINDTYNLFNFSNFDLYLNDTTLSNVFYSSINKVNENPLFSWAKDSFLVAPFAYIGNLFGVPSTSPLNTLLSYWLDISIIWLVFDLIMYVPLLVHRWLDKGVLE